MNDPDWTGGGFGSSTSHGTPFVPQLPLLKLNADATSLLLGGMDPGKSYSFYIVSQNTAGRLSDLSPVSQSVSAPGPPAGTVLVPQKGRVRIWGANDAKWAGGDGSEDSRKVIRIKWNYSGAASFTVYRCSSSRSDGVDTPWQLSAGRHNIRA